MTFFPKTPFFLTFTTSVFNHLVILLIIWQTMQLGRRLFRFDFLSAASNKINTLKFHYDVRTKSLSCKVVFIYLFIFFHVTFALSFDNEDISLNITTKNNLANLTMKIELILWIPDLWILNKMLRGITGELKHFPSMISNFFNLKQHWSYTSQTSWLFLKFFRGHFGVSIDWSHDLDFF